MEYTTNSLIISRKKNKELQTYNVLIALYDITDPHNSSIEPIEVLEFESVKQVVIKKLTVNFLTEGNDLVINGLNSVNISEVGDQLLIQAK